MKKGPEAGEPTTKTYSFPVRLATDETKIDQNGSGAAKYPPQLTIFSDPQPDPKPAALPSEPGGEIAEPIATGPREPAQEPENKKGILADTGPKFGDLLRGAPTFQNPAISSPGNGLTLEGLASIGEPESAKWEKYRIDLSISEPPPVPVLTVGDVPICTMGNITAISAKAKSGKSFLCTAISAAWISGDCLSFHGMPNQNQRKILYIDTEQSRAYVNRVAWRIAKLANLDTNRNPAELHIYSLKAISKDERKEAVRTLAYEIKPGLIIIDGPRDLITNFNDPAESTEVLQLLQTIVDELQCHLIGALHENKQDGNMRGHYGAEFLNKAESVISIVKEGTTFRVSQKEARGASFNDFAFFINEEILPELTAIEQRATRGKKPNPMDAPFEIHEAAIGRIFSINNEMTYGNLVKAIKADFAANWGEIGDITTKGLLTWYNGAASLIQKEKRSRKYTLISAV